MGEILIGIGSVVGGLAVFALFIWLTISISSFELSTANPIITIIFRVLELLAVLLVGAILLYILYLIYKMYTDKNMPFKDMKNKKTGSPEFE